LWAAIDGIGRRIRNLDENRDFVALGKFGQRGHGRAELDEQPVLAVNDKC